MTTYVTAAGCWTSPRLPADGDAVAAWAAETLAGNGDRPEGLAVATLDAGARESVAFWRASRETGLRYASPRGFPWTLSVSVAGRIAQELGVRGPAYTLVGRTGALVAALAHALDELASSAASRFLVVAVDGTGEETVRLSAVWLADRPAPAALATLAARASGDGDAEADRDTASASLAAAIGCVQAGDEAIVGSRRDGWVAFVPSAARVRLSGRSRTSPGRAAARIARRP